MLSSRRGLCSISVGCTHQSPSPHNGAAAGDGEGPWHLWFAETAPARSGSVPPLLKLPCLLCSSAKGPCISPNPTKKQRRSGLFSSSSSPPARWVITDYAYSGRQGGNFARLRLAAGNGPGGRSLASCGKRQERRDGVRRNVAPESAADRGVDWLVPSVISRHAVFCRICTRSLGQWSLAFLEHWSSPSPTNAVSLEVHSLAATFLDFSSSTRFLGSFSIGCLPGTFVPCGCVSVQQGVGDLVELSSCLNCQSFVPFNITKALKYQAPSASTVSCCLSQQPEF